MKNIISAVCVAAVFFIVNSSGAATPGYVGSEKCFECHEQQFNDWQSSGHPWKLRKV